MRLELVHGDITDERVDAIVNAANSSLLGGGGVDGAIHRRGGPAVLAECRQVRTEAYPDGLPAGQAVATTAGDLPARWVIHTVGPVYGHSDVETLRSCYRESLRVASDLDVESIAFPLISAGIYGWPADDAIQQALDVIGAADNRGLAHLVLFSADLHAMAERLMARR